MPSVQTTYADNIAAGYLGAIVNEESRNLISRNVEDSGGIAFGLAVMQGVEDKGCVVGDGSDFLGVTVRDQSVEATDPDTFEFQSNARIMTEGVIWVANFGGVAAAMWTFAMTGVNRGIEGINIAKHIAWIAATLFWLGVISALVASIRDYENMATYLIDFSCLFYLVGALMALMTITMYNIEVYKEHRWMQKMREKRGETVMRESMTSFQNHPEVSGKNEDIGAEKERESDQ